MLWICQSSVRFSTNVMTPLKADINRNCSKGSIKFHPGLYASPPESVITVSFVTDEPVMHSAVTMNIPLRITVASRVHLTADIYPKTLVSHTCGGHTPPHSFQTLSCLFFSIQQTSTTSVCQEIFVTLCSSSRVPIFRWTGSQGCDPPPTDMRDCDLSISIVARQQDEHSAVFDVEGKLSRSV